MFIKMKPFFKMSFGKEKYWTKRIVPVILINKMNAKGLDVKSTRFYKNAPKEDNLHPNASGCTACK